MKIPNLYINNKSKKNVMNDEIFCSTKNPKNQILNFELNNKQNSKINTLKIRKKINDIFNSPSFVYKVAATINVKNKGNKIETLIAKNKDNLLTINNELISIDDIIEIKEC